MNFRLEYEKRKQYIDSLVQRYAGEFDSPSKVLKESLSYSVSSGGKRLRAILALEFYTMLGGIVDEGFEIFLAALELLHLYTLVHDDLPCMDDDDCRRGMKSNHKVFGEGMALLCGDALLNYAFELLLKGALSSLDAKRYIAACADFSTFTGGRGVIGGQALEFEQGRSIDEASIITIYKHKTCDLIIAALNFVAVLLGLDERNTKYIKEFGYHFGLAFQIRDDFLDIREKGEVEKNSLLGLIGEKNADIILKESTNAAISRLNSLQVAPSFINELVLFAQNREF